jgi:predicted nucleic acid-binding protein
MLGLIRLLAQPRVMGEGVLSAAAAMAVYSQLSEWPGVGLLPEPAGCEAEYCRLVDAGLPGRLLIDAYLAAFAHTAGLRLVTFDSDFARFDRLARLSPN